MAVGGGVAYGQILPGVKRMRGDLCVRHHWFHCYFDDACAYLDVDGFVDTRYEEAAREVVGCRHQYRDADVQKRIRAHADRIPSTYRWLDERHCVAPMPCDCPAIISHRPGSQNILKEAQLNPEKDSRIKRARSHVSLEKSLVISSEGQRMGWSRESTINLN